MCSRALIPLLMCATLSPAIAQGGWTNHVDASFIKEIVHRDGELYMATNGGLLVYDLTAGTFEQFDNTFGLPSNFLSCLTFDQSGSLWVGMEDAGIAKVTMIAGGLIVRSLNAEFNGLSDNRVKSITAWDDVIVYGTEVGAGTVVAGFPATQFFERNGLPADLVNDVFVDGDFVWMATDSGVAVLDRLGIITPSAGGPPSAIVIERSTDALWVGTNSGVWRMDILDKSWTSTGPAGSRINSLVNDVGTMRAGGSALLYTYNGPGWSSIGLGAVYRKFSLNSSASAITALASVPGQPLLMGMGQPSLIRGPNLVRYDGQDFSDVRPNNIGGGNVLRLSVDIDQSLWVSSRTFGVGKLTPAGQWVNYNTSVAGGDSLSNLRVNITCLADSDGDKWFCTLSTPDAPRPLDQLNDQGDSDYDNDSWTRWGIGSGGGDGLGSLRLQRALEDPAGNRWFLSDEDPELGPIGWHGIHILSQDKSAWLQVSPTTESGMLAGNVTDAAFGLGSAYLALRDFGVQKWEPGSFDWTDLSVLDDDSWTTIGEIGGAFASGAEIHTVELRSDDVLWVGTTAGVYKVDPVFGIRHIEANTGFRVGLLSNKVLDILLDHDENLWVATELGLNRIDREDDNDIEAFTTAAAYQAALNLLYPPDVISPLANASCNSLAIHPSKDILYIGTVGGLSIYDFSAPGGPLAVDFSEVYVYPNPVLGRRGDASLKLNKLRVTGGSLNVFVEIYNLEGNLVSSTTLENVSGDDIEAEIWDLTTEGGFLAASGTYFVRIHSGGNAVVKSVAIIR